MCVIGWDGGGRRRTCTPTTINPRSKARDFENVLTRRPAQRPVFCIKIHVSSLVEFEILPSSVFLSPPFRAFVLSSFPDILLTPSCKLPPLTTPTTQIQPAKPLTHPQTKISLPLSFPLQNERKQNSPLTLPKLICLTALAFKRPPFVTTGVFASLV